MIELNSAYLSFGEKCVLNDVSITLPKGKVIGLIGKSGEGKTSILRILSGYLTPQKGEVYLEGKRQPNANELLIPGYSGIALVHQDFGLVPHLTVEENICEKILHLPQRFQSKLLKEMLNLLQLEPLLKRQAISLSGGEQQRVSMARALVVESDYVLLDEPFVHMDTAMKNRVIHYLQGLKEVRNTGFLIVSHNGEEIMGLCDQVVYLKNTKVRREATPEKFYLHPKSLEEAAFFGKINSLRIGGKRILFRPNQYNLKEGTYSIELDFVRSHFQGELIHNLFRTKDGQEVYLSNFTELKTLKKIYVS